MINIIIYGCLEQQETLLKAWINFSQTNRIIKASSQFSNNWMTGCLGVWVRGIRARAHVCIHVSLKLLMPVEGCQLCDAGRGTGRVPCPDSISFHLRTPANMWENHLSVCPHMCKGVTMNGRDAKREINGCFHRQGAIMHVSFTENVVQKLKYWLHCVLKSTGVSRNH